MHVVTRAAKLWLEAEDTFEAWLKKGKDAGQDIYKNRRAERGLGKALEPLPKAKGGGPFKDPPKLTGHDCRQ